mmetsp:Transcript_35460/g.84321  ORF Transcript_35460/g.84321 Transcript_35460/m.84321 type:complete len:237 (-) Transcript_35460:71-781(-)
MRARRVVEPLHGNAIIARLRVEGGDRHENISPRDDPLAPLVVAVHAARRVGPDRARVDTHRRRARTRPGAAQARDVGFEHVPRRALARAAPRIGLHATRADNTSVRPAQRLEGVRLARHAALAHPSVACKASSAHAASAPILRLGIRGAGSARPRPIDVLVGASLARHAAPARSRVEDEARRALAGSAPLLRKSVRRAGSAPRGVGGIRVCAGLAWHAAAEVSVCPGRTLRRRRSS